MAPNIYPSSIILCKARGQESQNFNSWKVKGIFYYKVYCRELNNLNLNLHCLCLASTPIASKLLPASSIYTQMWFVYTIVKMYYYISTSMQYTQQLVLYLVSWSAKFNYVHGVWGRAGSIRDIVSSADMADCINVIGGVNISSKLTPLLLRSIFSYSAKSPQHTCHQNLQL